jgi:hypothetical protein
VTADLDDAKKTMVNEMPSPACVPEEYRVQMGALRDSWEKRFGKATAKYKDVHQHRIKVQFVGVGFFDFIHGQTGVAKNGFELHPILAWQEVFAPTPVKGELRSKVDARMQFQPVVHPAFRFTELLISHAFFLLKPAAAVSTFQAP